MFADQLAIVMGNASRLVDENPQDRIVARALEFHINQFISLAFNNFLNELPNPTPFDSHAHNNKKVGETPTQKPTLEV